ncbi:MAG: hypothetical protein AABY22_01225, partial [Nanoarchaeota archaeon]
GQDFQSMQIREDDSIIYDKPFSWVENISFEESRYYNYLPYIINIVCFPQADFSGIFGVDQPSHEMNFSENDDGTVNLEHIISCKGFNTSATTTNALQNARGFVAARTGYSALVTPQFLAAPVTPTLISIEETVDRLNAFYQVRELFKYDSGDASSGILRYTTTFSSGIENGVSTVSIQGNIEGDKNQTLTNLRNRYLTFPVYLRAESGYRMATNLSGLSPDYITSGITEDNLNKRITFDVVFDNDVSPLTRFDYRIQAETDYLSDITLVNFDGTVKSRGDLKTRWERVSGYVVGLNVFDVINSGFSGFNSAYALNPRYLSSGIIWNSFAGEVSINVQLDNRTQPPSGFDEFILNIEIQPSIKRYGNEFLISNDNSGYYVSNLGMNKRENLSLDGNVQIAPGIAQSTGVTTLKSILNGIKSGIISGSRILLEKNSIGVGNLAKSGAVNFSCVWSDEAIETLL